MPHRIFDEQGRSLFHIEGAQRRVVSDLYHRLLTVSWFTFLIGGLVMFLVIDALFAVAYLMVGGIQGVQDGSFADAFFFSVQTVTTIGYGSMSPTSIPANILVTVESLTGLLAFAVVTGLVFARFARPTARILFSKVAVVSQWDGQPCLMLRMGNFRANHVAEARLTLGLFHVHRTKEGEVFRRIVDLPLMRGSNPIFRLTWTVIHPLDQDSPLSGCDQEWLEDREALLVASFTGLDDTFSQDIHARHTYSPDQILWGRRFVDILGTGENGERIIDYRHFHDTVSDPHWRMPETIANAPETT